MKGGWRTHLGSCTGDSVQGQASARASGLGGCGFRHQACACLRVTYAGWGGRGAGACTWDRGKQAQGLILPLPASACISVWQNFPCSLCTESPCLNTSNMFTFYPLRLTGARANAWQHPTAHLLWPCHEGACLSAWQTCPCPLCLHNVLPAPFMTFSLHLLCCTGPRFNARQHPTAHFPTLAFKDHASVPDKRPLASSVCIQR